MFKRIRQLALLIAVLSFSSWAIAASLSGKIIIDGSSTVYPITEAVAEEFRAVERKVITTIGISGTGGGFKRFVKGEIDITAASRPIKAEEDAAAVEHKVKYIELPVAYDGLTIAVNRQNSWASDITIDELKKIFRADTALKTWDQVRSTYPAVPIKIYAPGTDSGTFDYFKEVVAGKTGSIRSDMSVSEDDNLLIRGIAGNKGAIGFFGCAYYFENQKKLKALAVKADANSPAILPTPVTIKDGTYAPFSRPLFIYVNAQSADKPQIKAFVHFYFDDGPELAEEVGYVQLPEAIYQRARNNFDQKRTGTQYLSADGEKIHGPLEKVYK